MTPAHPHAQRAARRRRRRTIAVLAVLGGVALFVLLALKALQGNVLYFRMPSDLVAEGEQAFAPGRRWRLGGLVAPGSVTRLPNEAGVRFQVTDNHASVTVVYRGILPDLFREGQGVIAEGAFGPDRVFRAETVLAKHDERYMPREVYERIRKAGHPGTATGPETKSGTETK